MGIAKAAMQHSGADDALAERMIMKPFLRDGARDEPRGVLVEMRPKPIGISALPTLRSVMIAERAARHRAIAPTAGMCPSHIQSATLGALRRFRCICSARDNGIEIR